MQEKIINESGGGLLTGWDEEEISNCVSYMSENRDHLYEMKCNSYEYSVQNLRYSDYTSEMLHLMDMERD